MAESFQSTCGPASSNNSNGKWLSIRTNRVYGFLFAVRVLSGLVASAAPLVYSNASGSSPRSLSRCVTKEIEREIDLEFKSVFAHNRTRNVTQSPSPSAASRAERPATATSRQAGQASLGVSGGQVGRPDELFWRSGPPGRLPSVWHTIRRVLINEAFSRATS